MEISPDYHLIKIDESKHWSEEVTRRTTAIYGVYAFDKNSCTHVCEMTPSYCLMRIGADYHEIDDLSETERENLNELILQGEGESEPVTYMHVRDVESLIKSNPALLKKVEVDFEDINDLEENEQWNAIFDQIHEGWATGSLMY